MNFLVNLFLYGIFRLLMMPLNMLSKKKTPDKGDNYIILSELDDKSDHVYDHKNEDYNLFDGDSDWQSQKE